MNSVILMGRLTRDPELKQTQSGILTCTFSLAVERGYKNADGAKETDFITCVAWRQTAEFIKNYFTKGKMMALEGSLYVRKWVDSDGSNRYATEVVVKNVHFCAKENSNSLGHANINLTQTVPDMCYTSDDDLPF